jgi:hypothetical protein
MVTGPHLGRVIEPRQRPLSLIRDPFDRCSNIELGEVEGVDIVRQHFTVRLQNDGSATHDLNSGRQPQ